MQAEILNILKFVCSKCVETHAAPKAAPKRCAETVRRNGAPKR